MRRKDKATRRLNVLLIMQDALRRDHLGCYGYSQNTTPSIDRLAREGVLFRNTVAVSSHTLPGVVSLLTGQWPSSHRLMRAKDYARWKGTAGEMLPSSPLPILESQGYLVDGELVMRWFPLGFSRDTADFEGYLEQNHDRAWFFMAQPYSTHLPYNPPDQYYRMFLDSGFRPTDSTIQRLDVVRSQMLIHPPDDISAFEAGQEDAIGVGDEAHRRSAGVAVFEDKDKPGVVALYDGEIRVFDDLVGHWVDKLRQLEVLDDTLIIITADHGEELLDRGYVGHSSCNLHGTLFDECLMVPLIMRWPKGIPEGRVVEDQVSQVDLMPTIMDLLDLSVPAGIDGQSTLPLIRKATSDFRKEAYAETLPAGWQALEGDGREIWCVRTQDWKLILHTDSTDLNKRYQLYDLRDDPGERKDVYKEHGLIASVLEQKLNDQIARDREFRARLA